MVLNGEILARFFDEREVRATHKYSANDYRLEADSSKWVNCGEVCDEYKVVERHSTKPLWVFKPEEFVTLEAIRQLYKNWDGSKEIQETTVAKARKESTYCNYCKFEGQTDDRFLLAVIRNERLVSSHMWRRGDERIPNGIDIRVGDILVSFFDKDPIMSGLRSVKSAALTWKVVGMV
jgi:hypothetical protein